MTSDPSGDARPRQTRCAWCGDDALYVAYHDHEWGVPVDDDRALFERLMLEGMQAGLSWYTVLKKREHMRKRFFDFEPQALLRKGPRALPHWLEDPGLIRHRGKLEAMIGNARAAIELGDELAPWLWSFVDGAPKQNRWSRGSQIPSETAESRNMSRALKSRGFRFVGPTICYAFMQSAGLVNDHVTGCDRYQTCQELGMAWSV